MSALHNIEPWPHSPVPAEHALRGFHSVSAALEGYERTARLFTESFGYRLIDESGNRFRFASPDDSAPGRIVDLLCQPDTAMGRVAAGSVHHIAFRAKDQAEQLQWREHLVDLGYNVTPVIDRTYFHSIYFREPGGVLFEIATEPPGFTLDEKLEELGTHLRLPPWMESARSQIEQILADRIQSCQLKIIEPQPDFIHEFVPGSSSRTLLLLHGTGGNERDLIPLGRELDPNAALLSPRGKVLENGMPRFFRRLAEGVFDLEDLKTRTNELADFVAAAARHYKLASDHIVGVGYSNGANIAASMLLLRPEIMHAAILFRAMVPLIPDTLPDLSSVHVWIGAGDQDPIVPASETKRLAELLRRAGADVTIRFAKAGHGLTNDDLEAARHWLGELKP